ncbi:hypothetical protein L6164_002754 [Bauhinia variegata]|uniref:Uncharacterized protein n=1 Tax=Bauhinia variegata TaxID=167791 RepID=A0ACB9Q0N8_BAUVA|nr:hypothetical protein L6164_002754 [Bauhinia variegata]
MVKLLTLLQEIEVSECDNMKEIADIERQGCTEIEVVRKDDFPQLRRVKLNDLAKFSSFYSNGELLFDERVEINLESIEISSINISQIWSNPHLSSNSKFKSLIKLDVYGCPNLKYLLSFSMAKCLKNLQCLHVSFCGGMDLLIQENRTNETEVEIFPNLKEIKIGKMINLTEIWHKPDNQVGSDSYCHLESVHIDDCHKLVTVFPRHMVGMLKKLETLVVGDSSSVEVIFYIGNNPPTDSAKDTCLRKLQIWDLQNLEHVWSSDPEGILNFKSLQDVHVSFCHKINNLFPLSVAKGLKQLESLAIRYCDGMEQIVGSENGSNANGVKFELPNLTSVIFIRLRKKEVDLLSRCIDNYYLNNLKVLNLGGLKNPEFLFRLLHRTPNLEKLNLWDCSFKELLRLGMLTAMEKIGVVVQLKDFSLPNMGSLHDIGFEQDPSLFQQLQMLTVSVGHHLINLAPGMVCFNHLTYLEVQGCDGLINLMESSTAKSLSQLTTLAISYCGAMVEIVSKKESRDEREVKIAFHRLTTLNLSCLDNLTSFCSSECCSFMFPVLERLIVIECPKMKIFTQGVLEAPKLQKVYFEQEKWYWRDNLNETIRKGVMIYVEHLELSVYPHLEQFWQGKVPIPEKCFTNLKCLTMVNCEFLSTAIPYYLLPYLKKMKELIVRSCSSVEKLFDIFYIKIGRIHLESMTLENLPNLKNLENYFGNLTTLEVERCDFLSNVIPCNVVPCLKNLENLKVSSCRSVEKIFDVNDELLTSTKGLAFPLKYLTLDNLPALMNVWNLVKISQGIFNIPNLETVRITSCQSLNFVFPASLAENLEQLQSLSIENCEEMEEIVGKDETAAEGEFRKFKFPCLTELILEGLFKLKCFYPGKHNLECLKLESLEVFHCDMLEDEDDSSANECSLYSLHREIIPKQEYPTLNPKDTMMLSCGEFQGSLHNIEWLTLQCFHNVNEGDTLPCGFLNNVPNIKALQVFCSRFNMIFPAQRLELDDNRILTQIRELYLEMLPGLKSIGLEHSWIDPFCSNLQDLDVRLCNHLTTLVQSTVSFCNLKVLTIVSYHGLEYLFTSSTAKSLVQVEEMSINSSKSIKGIVAKEEDESCFDEIIFENLRELELLSLSSLLSFYMGNTTLNFPSLETVYIHECPRMEIFFKGIINAPKLDQVRVLYWPNNDFRWDTDLNTTIMKLLNGKNLKKLQVTNCIYAEVIFDLNDMNMAINEEVSFSLEILTLDQLPNLKHVWRKDLEGILSFRNLQKVQVSNCERLKALFTASLPKNLGKLKKLRIESCDAMEEIVGKDEASSTTKFVFPWLTSLVLSENPELKFFYAERHNLVLPKLEEVSLNEKEVMMLWHEKSEEALLHNIKCLKLYCFHNVNESDTLPFGFLLKEPNMETLAIACREFKEIFLSQRLEDEHIAKLAQLKGLRLVNLSQLSSIELEHSWQDRLCENLEFLQIRRCPRLTNIVQSAVSFSSLKQLLINQCHGLECLFTSSTAKSLVRLKEMCIEKCRSIKEIVGKEKDESTQDKTIFEQLIKLSLNSLPCLTSFHAGNSFLKLSSLHKLIITQCPKIKIFSQGSIYAPVLMGIQVSQDKYMIKMMMSNLLTMICIGRTILTPR